MGFIFSDDFDRPNEPIENSNNWVEEAGDIQVISEKMEAALTGVCYNTTSVESDDYIQNADFDTVGSGSHWIQMAIRMSGSTRFDDCYLHYFQEEGSNDWSELKKRVSGSESLLGSRYNHGNLGAGQQKISLEAVGTTITAYVNDTEAESVTDSSHSSEGDFGTRLNAGDSADNWEIDNFISGGSSLNISPRYGG